MEITNIKNYNEKENIFKIMITTDNHIGYLEQDQIRGNDSFNTFEEVLIKAKKENVDFVLHGGDLFHHHNPSKKTIIRTSHILQKHVFGHKTHNFETYCYQSNYNNENLSIALPIFIIHGNHDDPSGLENFSSIDIYSGKEVNYFGKINNYEEFELYPILFVKGETKVAVYGIGNLKDERLYIALQNRKVNFNRPEDYKNWFNILVVHQNRFKGHYANKSRRNYLPENFIPSFIDLVIWGHEHECFTETVQNTEIGFHIYQPGSSVATSLISAEAKKKHVGMIEVYKTSFRLIPVVLETSRPFIYEIFELKEKNIKNSDDIENFIIEKIENALKEAALLVKEIDYNADESIISLLTENITCGNKSTANNQSNYILGSKQYDYDNFNPYNPLPILPLIRLKIETSGHIVSRTNVIISKFSGLIANLHDVLQFYKKSENNKFNDKDNNNNQYDIDLKQTNNKNDLEDEMIDWNDEVKKYLNQNIIEGIANCNKKLLLYPEIFLDSLEKYVNEQDKKKIDNLIHNFYTQLCYEKSIYNKRLNWNYIKEYKIDDSNIAKKDNNKHIEEILKNVEFEFFNEKITNNQKETIKLFDNEDEMMTEKVDLLPENYDYEKSLFDSSNNPNLNINKNNKKKPNLDESYSSQSIPFDSSMELNKSNVIKRSTYDQGDLTNSNNNLNKIQLKKKNNMLSQFFTAQEKNQTQKKNDDSLFLNEFSTINQNPQGNTLKRKSEGNKKKAFNFKNN